MWVDATSGREYFPVVSHKKPIPARSGPVTGAKIVLALFQRPQCSGELAQRLGLDESYIRRTCRVLCHAQILQVAQVAQQGTPPSRYYSIRQGP